jgi:hypothetical protein
MGQSRNAVRATPEKPAKPPPDMQQTPQDAFFRSDNVLNAVEMELIWLGESMYCWCVLSSDFDFIYNLRHATEEEERKLSLETTKSRDGNCELEFVRMEDRLVSTTLQKDIPMNYLQTTHNIGRPQWRGCVA